MAVMTALYFDTRGRPISRAEARRQDQARKAAFEAETGMQIVKRLWAIPPGKVLIHPRSCELGGWYLVDADDPRHASRVVCDCGMAAPHLGSHYRKV
jgi:hypothetical protein